MMKLPCYGSLKMKKIVEFCQDVLSKKGIKEYEIYGLNAKNTVTQVKQDKTDFVQVGCYKGLSLRVLKEGKLGFSYTTNLDQDALLDIIERTIQEAEVTTEDRFLCFPCPAKVYPKVGFYDQYLETMGIEERINFTREMEKAAKEYSPYIKKVRQSQLKDTIYEIFVTNHHGKILHHRGTSLNASILLMAEKDGEGEMGWNYDFSPSYKDLNPVMIGQQAAQMAVESLGGKPIKTQRLNVVFTSQVASEILSVLSNAFLAEEVQKGKSLLASYLGKKAMSSLVNIVDDGLYPKGYATRPFDDEGNPQQKTVLVKEGVILGFLYDSYTAKKEGKASTGNGVKLSLETPPKVGLTNFYLTAGSKDLKEVLKELDKGLLVSDVLGMHTADTISGDFSVGISGYWIENGQKAFPVKGVAMAGNVMELFKNVSSIANDLRFWGHCGSPSILVEGIQVSGI